MRIESISIENFRNISSSNFSFHPFANFIVGSNGVGKTNLVESIYVNFFSRSFRTPHLKECIRKGEKNFKISSVINLKGVRHNLTIEFKDGLKTLRIDGKKYLIGEYIKYGMIFVITAGSSKIIYGEPHLKRKFFDSVIMRFYPEYIYDLSKFRKIYRNKIELIKKGVFEKNTFHIWNVQLTQIYFKIFNRRKEFVKILNEMVKGDFLSIENKKIKILYNPSIDFEKKTFEEVVLQLDRSLEKEILKGQLLFGPHRDRFDFFYDGELARTFASAGEKRSILLNIFFKLFELMKTKSGESPVFIFDDIDTEIDEDRIGKVINSLYGKTQIFITSSKEHLFKNFDFDKKLIYLKNPMYS